MRLMQITTRTVAGLLLLNASLANAQTTPVFRSALRSDLAGTTGEAIQGNVVLLDVGRPGGGTPDTIPDVLTVQRNRLVSVLFGKGDGTFDSVLSADLELVPTAFGAGVFDTDAWPDLLVAAQDGSIALFRGLAGEPPFERQGDAISAGTLPQSQARGFAVAKIDNDETVDALVAIGSSEGGGLSLLRGNGDGSFQPPTTVKTGGGAAGTAVAVGYFNTDGKLDAAVLNPDLASVTIFHQNTAGTGVFTVKQTVTFNTGAHATVPVAIAGGDFTGDDRTDLVIADSGNDTVVLLRALANGTFASPEYFSSGTSASLPLDVTVADVRCFNPCDPEKTTDGHLDVVVANFYGSDVSVLAGDGQGHFAAPREFVADQEPVAVAAGDVNNDGAADVVAVSQGAENATTGAVLLSLPGALSGVENVITDAGAEAATGGDVDGDGIADLLVAESSSDIFAYRSSGLNGFVPFRVGQVPSGVSGTRLERGDFNNDGRLDVVATSGSTATATVSVFLAQARGGFKSPMNSALQSPAQGVVAGDWDRDGFLDLAVATQPPGDGSGNVEVLLGNGDGSFQPPTTTQVDSKPAAINTGDFDNDGNLDLAVATANEISILLGNGIGGFVPFTPGPAVSLAISVAVADFDRDGADDLAFTLGRNGVVVYYGDGAGGFTKGPNPISGEVVASAVVARDVTGDGLPDLLVSDQSNSNSIVLLAKRALGSSQPPDRRFLPVNQGVCAGPSGKLCSKNADCGGAACLKQQPVRTTRQPLVFASADTTGEGRYDAAVVYQGPVVGVVGVATNVGGPAVLRADGNGDGRVTAADALAVIREFNDELKTRSWRINYQRVEQAAGGDNKVSAAVDSNGDGIVNPLDVVAAANRVFAGS